MDFCSFSRKKLQTLCKQNNIPANISKSSMIATLKALKRVEGIKNISRSTSESMNPQSLSLAPQNLESHSPELRRTSQRIKARKKRFTDPMFSIEHESESSFPVTRSLLRKRRKITHGEQLQKIGLESLTENAQKRAIRTPVCVNALSEVMEGNGGKRKGKNLLRTCNVRRSSRLSEKKIFKPVQEKQRGKISVHRRVRTHFKKDKEDVINQSHIIRRSLRLAEKKIFQEKQRLRAREYVYQDIIPGLPYDLALICLAKVPHRCCVRLEMVSKRWKDVIRSSDHISLRAREDRLWMCEQLDESVNQLSRFVDDLVLICTPKLPNETVLTRLQERLSSVYVMEYGDQVLGRLVWAPHEYHGQFMTFLDRLKDLKKQLENLLERMLVESRNNLE